MRKLALLMLVVFVYSLTTYTYAQVSKGGDPLSFQNQLLKQESFEVVQLPAPDMNLIQQQDIQAEQNGLFRRSGVSVKANLSIDTHGSWYHLADGSKVWRLAIEVPNAVALSVVYDAFYIPPGAKLFLYNELETQVIGAYDSDNNPLGGIFATELVEGEKVILEYQEPKFVAGKPRIDISEVCYAYRSISHLKKFNPTKTTGWGSSGACEVNMNCSPEGDNWQDEKRGVAEIWLRDNGGWGWCSGSLMNNTSYDGTPYFLTADHCGYTALVTDFPVWQFYFNYESVGCTTPGTEPSYQTLVGCVERAVGTITGGSDFLLVELTTTPGAAINPYYNGWDRTTNTSGGVGIHHPAGDIKKISTYNSRTITGGVNFGVPYGTTANNSAWGFQFVATANGHGVTEGGSSGSPLFNSIGLVVGTLSGGTSSCTNLTGGNVYGGMFYHWTSNGGTSNLQLEPWLDPTTTGATTCNPYDPFSTAPPESNFYGTPRNILEGQSVDYFDLSSSAHPITAYSWTFNGGTPGTSPAQDPAGIVYNTAGDYDVTLRATNANGFNDSTKTNYIHVLDPSIQSCDWYSQFAGTYTIYTTTPGGHVAGTNEFDNQAIAEQYSSYSPYNQIDSVMFIWADVVNTTSPNINVCVWQDNGSGAPGLKIATEIIPLATIASDFATDGFSVIGFSTPVAIPNGPFYVGFEIPPSANGDTIAVTTNNDADAGYNTGYTMYSNAWETYSSWGMTLSHGMMVNLCYNPFLPPTADFSGTPLMVNAGNTVTFTDETYGMPATSWNWTLSGGTPGTSPAQNPVITYDTPGYYDVTLQSTNANGTDSETKSSYIKVVNTNTCACEYLDNLVGTETVYTNGNGYITGTNGYYNNMAEYFPTHTYNELQGAWFHFAWASQVTAGLNVTVNVYDETNATPNGPNNLLGTGTIALADIMTDVANGDSTYLQFASPITVAGDFYIEFIPPTATAGDTIIVYQGDASAGTDDGWCFYSGSWSTYGGLYGGSSFNHAIYPHLCSNGAPQVDFVADQTVVSVGTTVIFTDLSTCGPTIWSWTLPGGTPISSAVQNPSVVYNTLGTYNVTLDASNPTGGNAEMKIDYITVLPAPISIVEWTFPNNPDDALSDGGIPINTGTKSITVQGGVNAPNYNNGGFTTNCAAATGWDAGNGTKYWQVEFNTEGYTLLEVNSRQNATNENGPRDYTIEYSTNGTVWNDVPSTDITIAVNNWGAAVVADADLPSACDNKPNVYLRWIMTSDIAIDGGIMQATRNNRIDDIYVTGVPLPPVAGFTASATNVCVGDVVNFSDNSLYNVTSWEWLFSGGIPATSTQPNPSIQYNVPGTYDVELRVVGPGGNDTTVITSYITVNAVPTVTASATQTTICDGVNTNLSATSSIGGTSFSWNQGLGAGAGHTVSPNLTTNYTVTGTVNGCTASDNVIITVNPIPTVNASATQTTLCNGEASTLNATSNVGGTTFTWDQGLGAGASQGVTPPVTTTYTVTANAAGCVGTDNVTITVNPLPIITANATQTTICEGATTNLSATSSIAGTNYTWNQGLGGGANHPVSPTTTTMYAVIGSTVAGCTGTDNILITVNPTPTITASATQTTICDGSSTNLSATSSVGGTTFTWDQGLGAGAGHTVSPSSTTTYTVIGSAAGCDGTANILITVNPIPTITAAATQTTICDGASTDLSATSSVGGTTFTWDQGLGAGAGHTVNPSTNTTYTVIGSAAGCDGTDNVLITVNPTPTITAAATQTTICNGSSTALSATSSVGGTTFTWDQGLGAGAGHTVSPSSTTTYTVIGTAAGCDGTDNILITVNPIPTITAAATQTTICNGSSTDLSATSSVGGTTYNWDQGLGAGANHTASPSTTTTYTVVGTAAGCDGTDNILITVNPIPTITAAATQTTICDGSSTDLSATSSIGGTTFTWDQGLGAGANHTASPSTTTTYTVIGTAAGCDGTDNILITVNPIPTITAAATQTTICDGSNTDLSATSSVVGTTYNWNQSLGAGAGHTVNPSSTTTYTVVGSASGCTGTDNITITVNPIPTITAAATQTTICDGSNTDLSATSSVVGTTYNWNQSLGAGAGHTVNPGTTTTYTVVGSASGCTGTDNITITVNPIPTITATATQTTICDGTGTDLSASSSVGGTTFTWDQGFGAGAGHTVSPSSTTTYTVIGTAAGCDGTDNILITVNPIPTITAAATQTTICNGSSTDLSATSSVGGTTYNWNQGLGAGANHTASPSTTTTYTVVGTAAGCDGTDNILITVNPIPTITASATQTTICDGSTTDLSATSSVGGTTFTWDQGLGAGANHTASPSTTTTYTVIGSAAGCDGTDNILITVNPIPTITAAATQTTICNGSTTDLSATSSVGGTTYTWDQSLGAGAGHTVNPGTTTTYTVVGSASGCTGTDNITITVNSIPTITAAATQTTICDGSNTDLSATSSVVGTTYSWNQSLGAGAGHTVNPSTTTTYTVVGSASGCTGTDNITITVNPIPTITAAATQTTICDGANTDLSATSSVGGTTFTWDQGLGAGAGHTVSPSTSTTYTVVGSAAGCDGTDNILITVNPIPTITAAATQTTICNGSSTDLSATSSVGGTTFTWNQGLGAGANHTASPSTSTTYTVVGSAAGCDGTDNILITVNPTPTITAAATQTTICNGSSTDLSATSSIGGTTYSWNQSLGAGAGHTVNPSTTTTYTVIGSASGCTGTDNVTITVNALPVANAGPDQSIITGNFTTLDGGAIGGSGSYTYHWEPAALLVDPDLEDPTTVVLTSTTIFTLTVTDQVTGCTHQNTVTVFVTGVPLSVTTSALPTMICSGENATLTALASGGTGTYSYSWTSVPVSVIAGIATPTVSPTTTTIYTLVVNDGSNTASANVTVTVIPTPVITAVATQMTICDGSTTDLSATSSIGGTTYSWNQGLGAGAGHTVNPSSNTIYTVTGDAAGCTASDQVSITVNPMPVVTASATQTTICDGSTTDLSATSTVGGTTFTWNQGLGAGAGHTVNPSSNTIYTVTGDAAGCTASDQVSITVNPMPVVTASATQTTICEGSSTDLSATSSTGGTTYNWNQGLGAGAGHTVNPPSSIIYTVTGDAAGCTASDQVSITVNPMPVVSASATLTTICDGSTTDLSATSTVGGTTYNWNQSLGAGAGHTVSPSSSIIYTVTGDAAGCTASDQVSITVNPTPVITASATQTTVCDGSSTDLSATSSIGGTSFNWDQGLGAGAGHTVTPAVNTTYTVIGNLAGCTASDNILISVSSTPVITAAATQMTICSGSTTDLSATSSIGGATYSWNQSLGAGATHTVSPSSSITYVVTGDAGGCTASDQVSITVNPTPVITASATSMTICDGSSTNISATSSIGGTTFNWDQSLGAGAGHSVSPSSSIIYTVTGDAGGCIGTADVSITVNPIPVITASATQTTICEGSSTDLSATSSIGGTTYNWNQGLGAGAGHTVNPPSSIIYTVTGDAAGCTASDQVSITVNPMPVVSASATLTTICDGSTTDLSATSTVGGTTYNWNQSLGAGAGHTVSPSSSIIYTVTGDAAGCTASDQVSITVNPTPVITASATQTTVCDGSSTDLSATSSIGGTSFNWDQGLGAGAGHTVTPAVNTTYTVIGNLAGCTASDNILISVSSTPVITAAATQMTICSGSTTDLSATSSIGGATYSWNQSLGAGATHTVSPSSSITYVVTGDAGGCTASDQVSITVNPTPVVTASATQTTICDGSSTNISATSSIGGTTYNWDQSLGAGAGHSVSPSSSIIYTVTGDAGGCIGTADVSITVNPIPVITAIATLTTICEGSSTDLSATSSIGGTTFNWDQGVGAGTPHTVSPSSNITYTVTGDAAGCTASDQVSITVNPIPVVSASATQTTICDGSSTDISATSSIGGTTFSWDQGVGAGTPHTVSPPSNIIYTVTGDAAGCIGTADISITVNPTPVITASATPMTICNGSSTNISATSSIGGTTFNWDQGLGAGVGHTVNPSSSITYVVTGDAAGCIGTADIDITVNPIPVVNAIATSTTICDGETTDISATSSIAGTTFSWDQGLGAGVGHTVNPSSNITYVVTGDAAGCIGTADIDITVNPTPVITASATSMTICDGSSTDISATSSIVGTNFNWNQGLGGGAAHTVNPSLTTMYVVTGDIGGCSSKDSVEITVNMIPLVIANATDDTICDGDNVTLFGSGTASTSYTWDNLVIDNVGFVPTATMTYTVTGSLSGCSATDQIEVVVNPLAVAGFTYVDGPGPQVTFTDASSNGTSYYWDFGDATTSTLQDPVHNYASSGTYYVMQIVTNSCNIDTAYDTISIISTGIITDVKELQMIVYPNPNNGSFKLDFMSDNKDTKVFIRIIDMTGRIVYIEEFEKKAYLFSTNISLVQYAKGIYQIQLISGDDVLNAKIVIDSRY
jgi:PKD repeat protein